MSAANPLEALAKMAEILDSAEYLDATSPLQRRQLRKMADGLAKVLEDSGAGYSAATLTAFMTGATTQKRLKKQAGEGGAALLPIAVAYLARDILAGGRTE